MSADHEMDESSIKMLLFPCINCAMSSCSSLHQCLVVNHLPWGNSTAAVGVWGWVSVCPC